MQQQSTDQEQEVDHNAAVAPPPCSSPEEKDQEDNVGGGVDQEDVVDDGREEPVVAASNGDESNGNGSDGSCHAPTPSPGHRSLPLACQEEEEEDDDEGYQTPTSPRHRLLPLTVCPPAPRRPETPLTSVLRWPVVSPPWAEDAGKRKYYFPVNIVDDLDVETCFFSDGLGLDASIMRVLDASVRCSGKKAKKEEATAVAK